MDFDPKHIPPLSLKLIQWFCHEDLQEEIEGNLIEYRSILTNSRWSNLKYWIQVLTYLRPSTFKKIGQNSKFYIMFNFNILLTFRNLWKQRATTLLNISGFTLGMLCVSLLYFYTTEELAYDSFHQDLNQIYRVHRVSSISDESYNIGVTSGPYADHLKIDFPNAIKSTCRVFPEEGLFEFENKKFKEDGIIFTDPNFFEFFSFPLSAGDPKTVLSELNSIVLTKASAQKYFGKDDPLGKTITIDRTNQFVVTGILADLPSKSHLKFDFVGNLLLFKESRLMTHWWNNGLITYARVENPTLAASVQERFPWFMDKYFSEDFERSGKKMGLKLEPLSDVYFNHDMKYDRVAHGNKQTVYMLIAVAIAILFIACFNYLNLAIAVSLLRAKEVSMRKILGSNRIRLVLQFLGESLLVSSISIGLAVLATQLSLPLFNHYFEMVVTAMWLDQNVLLFYAVLLSITVLLGGTYPALLMASFDPIRIFKGGNLLNGKNLNLRKALVIAQFSIAIFMIISTQIIGRQMHFVQNKNLGFDQESILLIDLDNEEIRDNRRQFKERLRQMQGIHSVTSMAGQPGGFHDATTVDFLGSLDDMRTRTSFVDHDYFDVFGIKIEAGRKFDRDRYQEDSHAAVINEECAKQLGISATDAIGQKFQIPMWDTLTHEIVGVVKDYHFTSLRDQIEPLIIVPGFYQRKIGVRLDPNQSFQKIEEVEKLYAEFAPNYPISLAFMDDSIARLYRNERKQGKIFEAFSSISLILACMGIFGLVSFAIERRRKEFGIRKTLGADVSTILKLISKEFVWMILISSALAIPTAWWMAENWLDNFAYRITLSETWYIFLIDVGLTLVIAIMTILFRSFRAANANPTDSLRYE